MTRWILASLASLVLARPALAQHEHGRSPYAGASAVEGTALTPEEIEALRDGEGMGLARAAELNHWPGPRHVLDLATDLLLDADQATRVREVFDRMHAAAVAKGEEIIQVERHLAAAFSSRDIDDERLARITAHLGRLRAELLAIHLGAHLETTRLLTPEQVATYDRLRGYAPPGKSPGD